MLQPTVGTSPAGFTVPTVTLPMPAVAIADSVRVVAARIVAAIARGATPEDVVLGDVPVVDDELERVEALDFVDMLAATLCAGAEARR